MPMAKEIIYVMTLLTDQQLNYMNDCLADKYMILTLVDNGVNISEDIRERITILIVHELSSEHLTHYKNLKFVQIYGRGTDKVCVSELNERKIYYQNCCSADTAAEAIAEYILLQILYWERNMPEMIQKGKHGNWSWEWRSTFQYRALSQLEVGVVGNGTIGGVVYDFLKRVGVHVSFINVGKRMKAEDELALGKMDYITVHLPLRKDTEQILDRDFFRKMKNNAVFINTSRGGIVDEEILGEALKSGIIRAASLDVTINEPVKKDSVLVNCENIIITPHISGRTAYAMESYASAIVDNIRNEVWRK